MGSEENVQDGWNEYSKLVLKELEVLSEGIQSLTTELHEVRKDILRLETKETKVDEIKLWKEKVDEIFSPTQMKDLSDQVRSHEAFKTKAVSIFAVIQFLMAVAIFAQKLL